MTCSCFCISAGNILSGNRSIAVLFNIAQMSNKRATEGAVVERPAAAMQCQSGRKGTGEVAGTVEEQQTQGPVLKKKRTEKKAIYTLIA